MNLQAMTEADMSIFGHTLGSLLRGGETIELIGDVGAGKTTLTKSILAGMGSGEIVQSPTFTINRLYSLDDGRQLLHYDFYRLQDPGIIRHELAESIHDPSTVTVVEWSDIVADVLPEDRLQIRIAAIAENERSVSISTNGESSQKIQEELEKI